MESERSVLMKKKYDPLELEIIYIYDDILTASDPSNPDSGIEDDPLNNGHKDPNGWT